MTRRRGFGGYGWLVALLAVVVICGGAAFLWYGPGSTTPSAAPTTPTTVGEPAAAGPNAVVSDDRLAQFVKSKSSFYASLGGMYIDMTGHHVCDEWTTHMTFANIAKGLTVQGTPQRDAGLLIGAATTAYCPQYRRTMNAQLSAIRAGFNNIGTLEKSIKSVIQQRLSNRKSLEYMPGVRVRTVSCIHTAGRNYTCLATYSNGRSDTADVVVSADGSRWISR